MKVTKRNNTAHILAQVKKIDNHMATCKHTTSGYQITATFTDNDDVEVNQIVELEYEHKNGIGEYKIVNTLVTYIMARVIEVQHIISNNVMYISLILEGPEHKRMHSLISSSTKLFTSADIIIKGDIVRIKVNNGNLFSIKHKE